MDPKTERGPATRTCSRTVMRKTAVVLAMLASLLAAGQLPATAAAGATQDRSFTAESAANCYYCSCKKVTAREMRVFIDSTSELTKWPHVIGEGTRVWAAQEANGRYHVSIWDNTGNTNGWISADPRWTDPC